jgi:hypothetical protein
MEPAIWRQVTQLPAGVGGAPAARCTLHMCWEHVARVPMAAAAGDCVGQGRLGPESRSSLFGGRAGPVAGARAMPACRCRRREEGTRRGSGEKVQGQRSGAAARDGAEGDGRRARVGRSAGAREHMKQAGDRAARAPAAAKGAAREARAGGGPVVYHTPGWVPAGAQPGGAPGREGPGMQLAEEEGGGVRMANGPKNSGLRGARGSGAPAARRGARPRWRRRSERAAVICRALRAPWH